MAVASEYRLFRKTIEYAIIENNHFDNRNNMDRFRELSTLVAVADEGAFIGAARRLNASPASVTRLVTGLESRLGVRLFNRTTRQVALTEDGRRLYVDAVRILAELTSAEAFASGARQTPRGVLRLTAPVLFGQRFIAPIVRDYLDAYPEMTADMVLVDRVVDLINEGLDVALRIGALPDSVLTATRVGTVRYVTVAAPDYLARAGMPERPSDLARHRIILPVGMGGPPDWHFVVGGKHKSVRLVPTLSVNTMDAAIDAASSGWGITRGLSYQVSDALVSGTLVEVLADWEDRLLPIHLVHSEGRRAAAKIRVFVDMAAKALRREGTRLFAR